MNIALLKAILILPGTVLVFVPASLLLQSLPIGVWFVFFAVANAVYIPFREEKGLEKRFGPEYIEYKKHVPRWFPRTTPWTGTH
jgi:protein-S-isoprenylcysteine O-methyltransferase Ste14